MPRPLLATNHPTYLRRLVKEVKAVIAKGSAYVNGDFGTYRLSGVSFHCKYGVVCICCRLANHPGNPYILTADVAADRFTDGRNGGQICASREA
jgi:hypothetical protein